jgi:hypothetical protein
MASTINPFQLVPNAVVRKAACFDHGTCHSWEASNTGGDAHGSR